MDRDKANATAASGMPSELAGCTQEIQQWYQSGPGLNAARGVQTAVNEMSNQVFGYYALQVGAFAQQYTLLQDSRISNCFTVGAVESEAASADLIAGAEALPVAFDDIDLVVASHVLDCTDSPHQVLREIERVLVPEGHCILISYNPFSWRGLTLFWKRLYKQNAIPTLYTTFRLKDWFAVLGFEVLEVRTTGFRERGSQKHILQRFGVLKTMSAHYRRLFGNVRLLHVRRKVPKMTPINSRLRTKPLLKPGMAVNSGGVGKSINKTIDKIDERLSRMERPDNTE